MSFDFHASHRRRLLRLERKVIDMAADITALTAAVASLDAEVQNVVAVVNAGSKPDQAEVDAVTASVTGAVSTLQSVAPGPAPAPAPEEAPAA